MHFLYVLALRLFLAFLTAKFLLVWIGWEGLWPLVGFTLLFLVNCYFFDFLDSWEQKAWRRLLGTRRQETAPPAGAKPPSVPSSPSQPNGPGSP